MPGITEDTFGEFKDPKTGNKVPIKRYTLKNSQNCSVQIISYGATITSIKFPDKNGKVDDVVLGFDKIDGYLSKINPYFGATVGRYANRIKNGEFELDGKKYTLAKNNDGKHHLHGGNRGFDKVMWNGSIDGESAVFKYTSAAGEEGYPGKVDVVVTFCLTDKNELRIAYDASVDAPTPVNLTNHSYFNLAGHGSGNKGIREHYALINADHYTPPDSDGFPTGDLTPVDKTPFDLRCGVLLKEAFDGKLSGGYDHNWALNDYKPNKLHLRFACKVSHPPSGRFVELYSNEPGLVLYTGGGLPKEKGKEGTSFEKLGAFCIEPGKYPNSPNMAKFPSSIVKPGVQYAQIQIFKFGVEL